MAASSSKRGSRPAPRRAIPIFAAAALLITGIFIGRNWPRPKEPDEARVLANAPALSSETSQNIDPQPPPPSHGPVPKPKLAPGFATAPGSRAAPVDDPGARPSPTVFIAKGTASASDADLARPAPGSPTVVTTTFVPLLTLSGEIFLESDAMLPFELSLRRDAAKITGLVRYLSGDGKRVAANSVVGTIKNRVLELRETSRIWIATASIEAPPDIEEPGRSFVFELPEANSPTPVSGLWRRGPATGRIELQFAAPW